MTAKRRNACEVAVIGAGPYGLSVAAHLKQAGLSTRVFGEPMSFWRRHMPKGMRLRSPWRATNLSDPGAALSLDAFATEHGADRGEPLALDKFVAYGEWFQDSAVPELDHRAVHRVDGTANGFQLELADGEIFAAGRVVIATGLANQDYRPQAFHGLPTALVSHTCEHADFAPFRGRHVAVVGRGQSACESAVLLAESGATVELISRGAVHWLGATTNEEVEPTAIGRLRETLAAPTAVGPFPLSWLVEAPALVRHIPVALRDRFTTRCLKAGAAGWLKPRFPNVICNQARAIVAARPQSDRIVLELDNDPRGFDHVVLGTGYHVDISRLGILSPQLLRNIACADGSPLLRSGFESSVAKLHFVGSSAVKSFGPLMRFVAGTSYAARAVTRAALGRGARRSSPEFPPAVSPVHSRSAADPAPPR
jgi:cation diffusion facilitator CzcD-associated flavoprotein CzcO